MCNLQCIIDDIYIYINIFQISNHKKQDVKITSELVDDTQPKIKKKVKTELGKEDKELKNDSNILLLYYYYIFIFIIIFIFIQIYFSISNYIMIQHSNREAGKEREKEKEQDQKLKKPSQSFPR